MYSEREVALIDGEPTPSTMHCGSLTRLLQQTDHILVQHGRRWCCIFNAWAKNEFANVHDLQRVQSMRSTF